MGKWSLFFGTRISGGGVTVAGFLTTLRKMVEKFLLVETKDPLGQRTNSNVIFRATIDFNGLKYKILSDLERKPLSFGQFGTKRWRWINGELGLPRPLSQINAFFVFPILMSRSNINYGIASKLGGLGGGPPTLCMNFVGWDRATMIVSIGSKLSLGKCYSRNMALRSKFGTSLEASLFGSFGLNAITRFLTINNGMKHVSNTTFATSLSYMPRWRENVFSKTLKLVFSRLWIYSKASTTRGELRTCFLEGATSTLSVIGRNVIILGRWVVRFVKASWWAFGGLGVVLGGLFGGWLSRLWQCSCARGACPPPLSVGMGVFFLVLFILALAVGLLSPKKQKCGSNEWKCMWSWKCEH